MTPYFQDDAVTIYHGEDCCCAYVVFMVICLHENTQSTHGSRTTTAIPATQGGPICCSITERAEAGVHENGRGNRKAKAFRKRSPRMDGRRCERQGWPVAGLAPIPSATVFCLRAGAFRASPLGRQHSEQRTVQHSVCLPEMPHGKGWAS